MLYRLEYLLSIYFDMAECCHGIGFFGRLVLRNRAAYTPYLVSILISQMNTLEPVGKPFEHNSFVFS